MWGVASSLPSFLVDAFVTRSHLQLRQRYYKKLAREAQAAKRE